MNPLVFLDFARLNWRALLIFVGVVAAFAYGWSVGAGRVQTEWDAAKVAQLQAALEAEQSARAKEQSMQQKIQEAQHAATERETKLRADADAARAAAGSLRDTVAALRGELSAAPAEACRVTADAALAVFGECADRYQRVAEAADRHASDAQLLADAWPE